MLLSAEANPRNNGITISTLNRRERKNMASIVAIRMDYGLCSYGGETQNGLWTTSALSLHNCPLNGGTGTGRVLPPVLERGPEAIGVYPIAEQKHASNIK
ncbi:hypothetical protein EVAR_89552_1 [Eumeta japonica]|uniref:Uncharacterized protein n=1 Tax=Eumeta variegata TaxID=151549 RepID=A0A4C1ZCA1_EUMVA|nr:hypothetical protein EVAR_89552_1 [Eumeta japonica]